MRRSTAMFVLAGMILAASPAAADSGDRGACHQTANALFVALSAEGTRGDFMSDVICGNEPNMANGSPGGPNEQTPGTQAGNVLATWSPGPFVNDPVAGENQPPRNDRTRGFGGGDLQALVRAACTASQ